MTEDLKNNFPALPDLNMLMLQHRVDITDDPIHKELNQALLAAYSKGMIEVHYDLWSGELQFSPAELN